jgi:hypothetical protein
MADLDPEFAEIFQIWQSEAAIYRFFDDEFTALNCKVFDGRLSPVRFQIKPMWLSHGLLGERNSGGDYEPAEKDWAPVIGIFTSCLRDKEKTRRVFVHEMIHHWETTVATENETTRYPRSVDAEISKGFSDPDRERRWRNGHSKHFIAKAYSTAETLGFPIRSLLFG